MKLIIEMEMPKDCPMCPMAHYNKLDEFTGCEVAPSKRYAVKTDKAYAESSCRPSWCPIIGALPEQHGRLGDLDELAAGCDDPYWCRWLSEIEDAPTIVPATERSET